MSQERNEKRLLKPVQLVSKETRKNYLIKIDNPIIYTPEPQIKSDEQESKKQITINQVKFRELKPFQLVEQPSETYRREAANVVSEMLYNRKSKLNLLRYKGNTTGPYANIIKIRHKRIPSEISS